MMDAKPFYFATHCEMQDAAQLDTPTRDAPGAASIALAKLVARFETQIDDEWRADLIHLGGMLMRLQDQHDASALLEVE